MSNAEHQKKNYVLSGESARKSISEDEFGLARLVSATSSIFQQVQSNAGYVIGIEGSWGAGKSTFINFLIERIQKDHSHYRIMRFEPWLIGEKNALLAAFLGQLARDIDDSHEYSWWQARRWFRLYRRHSLAKRVRKYGEYLGALSHPIGATANADPTGTTAAVAAGLKSVGILSKFFGRRENTIASLKEQIDKGLNLLHAESPDVKFIIIIDDTDRLEPNEAGEVVRLVRKVANFPLVCYALCFDRNILAEQISKSHQISDGHDFLEKIFQLIVSLPPQEPFALRRYARRELEKHFPQELNKGYSALYGFSYRSSIVLDIWFGRLLETPRDVARLVEAIKAGWPQVPSDCDFFDFVWLQLIKLKSPELFSWTREYLANLGAYRDGGQASSHEQSYMASQLAVIMKTFGWHEKSYQSGISELLPGCSSFCLSGEKQKVFEFQYDELTKFESECRLGSPSHWRYYFAFDSPSYAVGDLEIKEFLEAAKSDHERAEEIIRALSTRRHDRKGHYLATLLDRLLDRKRNSFTAEEQIGFVKSFSRSMDYVAEITREIEVRGRSEIWASASKLLSRQAAKPFIEAIGIEENIGWLAYALRDQGFALGLAGHRHGDQRDTWLTEEEVKDAASMIARRVDQIGIEKILNTPGALGILFCWLQLANGEELKQYLAHKTADDKVFLLAINAMRGWSSSSDGISHPIHADYVGLFFNSAEEIKSRLESLALNSEFSEQANRLLLDWQNRERS